jgi:hypothetical protein
MVIGILSGFRACLERYNQRQKEEVRVKSKACGLYVLGSCCFVQAYFQEQEIFN